MTERLAGKIGRHSYVVSIFRNEDATGSHYGAVLAGAALLLAVRSVSTLRAGGARLAR